MAFPIIPAALVGFGGYAVYRAFRDDKTHRSNPNNGWRNEAFSKSEERRKGRK
jgi:hypothetical protein